MFELLFIEHVTIRIVAKNIKLFNEIEAKFLYRTDRNIYPFITVIHIQPRVSKLKITIKIKIEFILLFLDPQKCTLHIDEMLCAIPRHIFDIRKLNRRLWILSKKPSLQV